MEYLFILTNLMFRTLDNTGMWPWIVLGVSLTWGVSVIYDILP